MIAACFVLTLFGCLVWVCLLHRELARLEGICLEWSRRATEAEAEVEQKLLDDQYRQFEKAMKKTEAEDAAEQAELEKEFILENLREIIRGNEPWADQGEEQW